MNNCEHTMVSIVSNNVLETELCKTEFKNLKQLFDEATLYNPEIILVMLQNLRDELFRQKRMVNDFTNPLYLTVDNPEIYYKLNKNGLEIQQKDELVEKIIKISEEQNNE